MAGNWDGPVEGRGALFTVHEKKHPKAPDFKGDIIIGGKKVKLSAWKKDTRGGVLISLVVDTFEPGKKVNQQVYPKEVEPKDGGDVPW